MLLSSLGLLSGSMPSQAHHRHQYYYHWSGFPTQISVYNCSADATTLQSAVNNWNANGGFGTLFVYQGTNCSPANGIVAKNATVQGSAVAELAAVTFAWRDREVLKDSTQAGRVWFSGAGGQVRLTKAELRVESSVLYSVNTYAHELGHAIGLNEHYVDTTGISCVPYAVATVMDCSGNESGPQPHDAADGPARYNTAPWGPGAIWISHDTGSSITIQWADINDNETGYRVMMTTAPGIGGEQQVPQLGNPTPRDVETFTINNLSSGNQYCFHLKVMHHQVADGYSSQICRQGQPGSPPAPTGISVYGGPNNYTADLYWDQPSTSYTHHFVTVYKSGFSGYIARYYLPYSGAGTFQKYITLGYRDELPGTYFVYVSACNAKYNAWSPFSCSTLQTYATIYLQP